MKSFTEKVLDIVRAIPKGSTMTYKEVAKKAAAQGLPTLWQYYEIKFSRCTLSPSNPQ